MHHVEGDMKFSIGEIVTFATAIRDGHKFNGPYVQVVACGPMVTAAGIDKTYWVKAQCGLFLDEKPTRIVNEIELAAIPPRDQAA